MYTIILHILNDVILMGIKNPAGFSEVKGSLFVRIKSLLFKGLWWLNQYLDDNLRAKRKHQNLLNLKVLCFLSVN